FAAGRRLVLPGLFVLMPQLRPVSIVVPYTTLFRSSRRAGWASSTCPSLRDVLALRALGERGRNDVADARGEQLVRHDQRAAAVADRKSTRLNSSHSQISYAVFCLKKKTVRRKSHTV